MPRLRRRDSSRLDAGDRHPRRMPSAPDVFDAAQRTRALSQEAARVNLHSVEGRPLSARVGEIWVRGCRGRLPQNGGGLLALSDYSGDGFAQQGTPQDGLRKLLASMSEAPRTIGDADNVSYIGHVAPAVRYAANTDERTAQGRLRLLPHPHRTCLRAGARARACLLRSSGTR